MSEKQFPQVYSGMLSSLQITSDLYNIIMDLPQMVDFHNFEDFYFMANPDVQVEDIPYTIQFLTERNQ